MEISKIDIGNVCGAIKLLLDKELIKDKYEIEKLRIFMEYPEKDNNYENMLKVLIAVQGNTPFTFGDCVLIYNAINNYEKERIKKEESHKVAEIEESEEESSEEVDGEENV
jgi:hypothetical protein